MDMDAFFAAIEQRDHPEWRGKPVVVGSPPDQRGVVSTCSYEARAFGVHSAMPSRMAFEHCPQAIFVKPRMTHYTAVSRKIFAVFSEFTPLVEGVSVDEAFLDITHVQRLFGSPRIIAQRLKQRIYETVGLTCSIGIASNKSLAKLASEERKPNGLFEVPSDPTVYLSWLGAKPIRALWGIGPKCAAHLEQHGIKKVCDLQRMNSKQLLQWFPKTFAEHLIALAFGKDERAVQPYRPEKSYSREHTYPEDVTDKTLLQNELLWITQDVGRRLREAGLWAKTGKLKIRYTGFRTVTRQITFKMPLCDDFALRDIAWQLLDTYLEKDASVRLIGFGVESLQASPLTSDTEDLFAHIQTENLTRIREEKLSKTLDTLRKRFGSTIVNAATLTTSASLSKENEDTICVTEPLEKTPPQK